MRIALIAVMMIVSLLGQTLHAQTLNNYRPKIGLVLSGGGAKGLVYIPLLKAIDSLGIQIDYISATSMGALIGGLYSIGYTGNELDSIARSLNWEDYLSDDLPMSKINMEEKDEYGKYLLELKSNKIAPSLPMGVIEGQNIMRLLNDLTFNVQHMQDFSEFKIPFKCFAADIVKGVPVEICEGSLAQALRTSMSIPTVFAPIDRDEMLLVDGGIVKNFPVEDVIDMGVDFVIGANSSGYHLKKRELTSLFRVFEQMLNVSSTEDYQKQKDLCDILIDYSEALNLEGLSSSDFNRAADIIDLGQRVLNNFLPMLEDFAAEQKKFLVNQPSENKNWRENNEVKFEKFQVNVEDNEYQSIIRNKIEFKDPNDATRYEINRAVDRVYGTRFFDRVYYYMEFEQDSTPKLVFKTEGAKKFAYKIGLHYDPELSAGIVANLTYRKLGKYTYRSTISLDISNNPKVRGGYQIYFGDSGWWLNTEHFFSSIEQISYNRRKSLGSYNHLYSNDNVSVNWTIGQNNLVSMGTAFEFFNRKTSQKEEYRFAITKSPYYNIHLMIKMVRNTLDRHYLPNKGILAQAHFKYVPWGNGYITKYADPNEMDVDAAVLKSTPHFSAYAKLHLQYEQYIPLHKIFTLNYRADLGMMFISHGLHGRTFDFSSQDAFFLGGVDEREKERQQMLIPFLGNKEGYAQAYNFALISVAGQIQPINKLYVIPKFSFLFYDDGDSNIYGSNYVFPNQIKNHFKWAISGGATIAYLTPIGPIKVSLSKATNHDKMIFYMALGYRF